MSERPAETRWAPPSDHAHLVAVGTQAINDVAPDKPSTTGDEYLHDGLFLEVVGSVFPTTLPTIPLG
jgi:hypothetical protein